MRGRRQRRGREREAARRADRRHRAAQRLHDFAPQRLPLVLAAGMQERNAARQVVEHQQRARRDIMGVRSFRGLQAAAREPLEVADRVVGGVADETAEQRHAGHLRQGLRGLGEGGAQGVEKLSVRFRPGRSDAADMQARRIEPHFQAIAEADEGIAREPLAALDAFQQEPRAQSAQFHIGRHRRVEVGGDVERWLHKALRSGKGKTIKKPISAFVAEMGSSSLKTRN